MRNRNEITDTAPPRRIYFHHEALEEYEGGAGMWRLVSGAADRDRFVHASADLMANPTAFRDAMRRALVEWPNSCTNAMTTQSLNQRAWMGHAGCYLGTGSPEETTRLGWHTLDDAEQYAANDAADQVIAEWRKAALVAHSLQFDMFDLLAGSDA